MTEIFESKDTQEKTTNAATTVSPTSNTITKPGFKIKDFLYLCLSRWYWFAISIFVCLCCAFVYIKSTTPTYRKSASILIKTDSRGRTSSQSALIFEDLGINAGGSSLLDELEILRSPDLMQDVVRKLNLEISYKSKGKFREIDLYGSQLPVQVSLPDIPEDETASFKLNLNGNGQYTISEIVHNGTPITGKVFKGQIGTMINTPLGRMEVKPAKGYDYLPYKEIYVTHRTVKAAAGKLLGGLNVENSTKGYNLVNLTLVNSSPERASDVLGQLIASYSDRWMNDKKTLADNASKFIDDRVELLQRELGSVDDNISSYKSANLVPDVDAAASLYMSQATQASMALKDLRNQEYMAKYIRNYLRNSENQNSLLPSNAGLTNAAISNQIAAYNTKILERNSLVAQSSESNPLVAEIDAVLSAMRGALVGTLDNELVALGEQIRSQEGLGGTATSKIASNPKQAKYLLSVERQQKVKETLYLYLLQKREENQLNQAFTSYNTRIVREPDGSNAPIAPNTSNIYLIAFAIGIALPALILFQREISISTVRGRNDLKGMKIPFAGELPLHAKKQKLKRLTAHKKDSKPHVVVKENSRNSINEAFRVLRTNIEFMLGNKAQSHVIMLTSANPGSGKTFVSYNLGKSLAIKGKSVVIIDLDLRRASLSKFIDKTDIGVSDYLANRVSDITSIIKEVSDTPNFSLIPVGTIPPNPTELLFNERLNALIMDLKMHYDYVIIDCPPIEIVADASIISKYVDYTLFVVRAGYLELAMLPVIDEMYQTAKYPNMSLILNGTINPKNGYASRYGNPYSYGYGYGTGYYTEDD